MHRAHAGRADEIADRIDREPEPASTVQVEPAACRASRVIVATASSTDGWPPDVSTDVTAGTRSSASKAALRSRDTSNARWKVSARPSAAAAMRASAPRSTSPRASSAPGDAVRPGRDGCTHVAFDHAEIVGVIDERPAVRSHDHVDGNRHGGHDGFAGRRSASARLR